LHPLDRVTRTIRAAAIAAAVLAAPLAHPQESARVAALHSTPSEWDEAFADFAAADRAAPPPEGGVLFVGSSSIRLWNDLESSFNAQPVVIKRGFGGSKLSDCVANLGRLVVRYRPRTVLVYAGDNDLATGSAPEDVLRRFTAFVEGVHRDLPQTRIDYISIKPSPSRRALLPSIRAANALIARYVAAHPDLAYIDVFTPMLDARGEPRPDLFQPDLLHLNHDGYALWKSVIAPYVVQVAAR
jgi:lysophospholipase L1-like esterase